MAFIGTTPKQGFTSHVAPQSFSSSVNGVTTQFTLNKAVASENDLEVFVGNVRQEPGSGKAYTASGTTLTFTEAPANGLNVYVNYKGQAQVTSTPLDASISTQKLVDDAVTGAKIAPTIATNHTFSGTNTFSGATTVPAATSSWRHIKTLTGANASTIDFRHGVSGVIFDDTYDVYEFIVHYCYMASGATLRIYPFTTLEGGTDNNSLAFMSGAYHSGGSASVSNTLQTDKGVYRSSVNCGTGVANTISGSLRVHYPFESTFQTVCLGAWAGQPGGAKYLCEQSHGTQGNTGRTYGMQFKSGTANIYAKISLYGIKEA